MDQAADVLGCSPGNVKSLSARALDKLRTVLGDVMAEPVPPGRPVEDQYKIKDSRHG